MRNLRREGLFSCKHFIHHAAEGPHIALGSVCFVYELGAVVSGCAPHLRESCKTIEVILKSREWLAVYRHDGVANITRGCYCSVNSKSEGVMES